MKSLIDKTSMSKSQIYSQFGFTFILPCSLLNYLQTKLQDGELVFLSLLKKGLQCSDPMSYGVIILTEEESRSVSTGRDHIGSLQQDIDSTEALLSDYCCRSVCQAKKNLGIGAINATLSLRILYRSISN